MTMSQLAKPETHQTYHIFLASPGDMDEERRMVREFFDGYNRNIANRQHLEFKVIDWEHYSNSGVGRTQAAGCADGLCPVDAQSSRCKLRK